MELSIKELCKKIDNNEIILPNFQREFVWNINQQKGLIASVLTSIPCTSSLIVTNYDPISPKFDCKKLGFNLDQETFIPTTHKYSYLLDGQQRYTSIYFAFSNVYTQPNSPEKEAYYQKLFKNLCNRWVIKIDNDCFGYNNLFFDKAIFDTKLPDDIIEYIECFTDINQDKSEMYIGNELSKIRANSVKNKYIPLFIFIDYFSEINTILNDVARNKLQNLKTDGKFDLLDEIFKNNSIQGFDVIKEKIISAKDNDKKIEADNFFNSKADLIIANWSKNIIDLLNDKLADKYLNCVELNDINKAIATFSHINSSGTKLSTFDLICSRSINLRKNLIEELQKEFYFNGNKVKLVESFKIYDKKTGLNSQFLDFFMHTFNIIHFLKNSKNDLNSSVLKQSYSLAKEFDNKFINDNYKDAVLYSKIICYLLNNKLGHKEFKNVTNKLSLIPLVSFIVKNKGKLNDIEINKIRTFFWVNLFSAKYSKDQNEQCIKDCVLINDFIAKNRIDNIVGILDKEFFKVKDFANKESLCNATNGQKVNSNAIKNIIHYILSELPNDFLTNKEIDINKVDVEVHHIIPLANQKTIGLSTKEIRKNENHLLNSVMNLTPITQNSNREISSLNFNVYENLLSTLTMGSHHLTDDWRIQFDSNNEIEIISLFEKRYELLIGGMIKNFNNYINK